MFLFMKSLQQSNQRFFANYLISTLNKNLLLERKHPYVPSTVSYQGHNSFKEKGENFQHCNGWITATSGQTNSNTWELMRKSLIL